MTPRKLIAIYIIALLLLGQGVLMLFNPKFSVMKGLNTVLDQSSPIEQHQAQARINALGADFELYDMQTKLQLGQWLSAISVCKTAPKKLPADGPESTIRWSIITADQEQYTVLFDESSFVATASELNDLDIGECYDISVDVSGPAMEDVFISLTAGQPIAITAALHHSGSAFVLTENDLSNNILTTYVCPDGESFVTQTTNCFAQAKAIPAFDTDQDGLADVYEFLPYCRHTPDCDGDGIGDQHDFCPLQAGDTHNHGCSMMSTCSA